MTRFRVPTATDVQFLATPDIRRGQYHVRDFTRAHEPPAATPSERAAYWSRMLEDGRVR